MTSAPSVVLSDLRLPCPEPAAHHSIEAATDRLNHECFCFSADRAALHAALQEAAADPDYTDRHIALRPHLFSGVPLFLPLSSVDAMRQTVRTIEAMAGLPAYRDAVLSWAPAIAGRNFGPRGAFMGYDFHQTAKGPRLIEVNTNAGGAFLNAFLRRAQRACCTEAEGGPDPSASDGFDAAVLRMFVGEWHAQGRVGTPGTIAIVDDQPAQQYLYPEFVLAQRFFERHGIAAVVVDPAQLSYRSGRLRADDRHVDLVYNRLVDFALSEPAHAALRAAYLDGAAVVTPNPHVHALFADKRNLTLLSDPDMLRSWGVGNDVLADLARVPHTRLVTAGNASELWACRKQLFFKPAGGHGGKAVYRGDKLTRSVWAGIVQGGYVAQALAAPSERTVEIDGRREIRKADVRLYVYDGQVLLTAARLYRGQTTNFRTPGGGFAPVLTVAGADA